MNIGTHHHYFGVDDYSICNNSRMLKFMQRTNMGICERED